MRYSYCAIEKLWIDPELSPTTKPYFFVHPTDEPLVQMSGNSTRFFLLNQKKKKLVEIFVKVRLRLMCKDRVLIFSYL